MLTGNKRRSRALVLGGAQRISGDLVRATKRQLIEKLGQIQQYLPGIFSPAVAGVSIPAAAYAYGPKAVSKSMPYRRKYGGKRSTKRSYKRSKAKRKYAKRKRTYKKRRGGLARPAAFRRAARSYRPMRITMVAPRRTQAVLRLKQVRTFTPSKIDGTSNVSPSAATNPSTATASIVIPLNSMTAPQGEVITLGTSPLQGYQPQFFDQYMKEYDYYRVNGIKITAKLLPTVENIPLTMVCYKSQPGTASGAGFINNNNATDDSTHFPCTYRAFIQSPWHDGVIHHKGGYQRPTYISRYFDIRKSAKKTQEWWSADRTTASQFVGTSLNNPPTQMTWQCQMFYNHDSTVNVKVNAEVQIDYYCEFFSRHVEDNGLVDVAALPDT